MSGRREEDFAAVAWPGFVDILSAVIIMFVFFVMITASALYFHILIFKSKVLSETDDSLSTRVEIVDIHLAKKKRQINKKIEEMTEDMKIIEKIVESVDIQIFKEASQMAESKEQDIREVAGEMTIVIFFGEDAISLTEESKERLSKLIPAYMKQVDESYVNVKLISGKDPDHLTDSAARKFSLARMMNVRNMLLANNVPKDRVTPVMGAVEEIDSDKGKSYNWVKIVFGKIE